MFPPKTSDQRQRLVCSDTPFIPSFAVKLAEEQSRKVAQGHRVSVRLELKNLTALWPGSSWTADLQTEREKNYKIKFAMAVPQGNKLINKKEICEEKKTCS